MVTYNAGEDLLSKLSKQCEQSQEAAASDTPKRPAKTDNDPSTPSSTKGAKVSDVKKKSISKSAVVAQPGLNILARKDSKYLPSDKS